MNASGCDVSTCLARPGWVCIQPGAMGMPDRQGNVTIPGPDGQPLVKNGITQGWGAVPYYTSVVCWCNNVAGTFTTPELDCVPQACPFPQRCIDHDDGLPGNGTKCVEGSEGPGCLVCSKKWYRYNDDCVACPTGIPVGLILLAVIGGLGLLYVSSVVSQIATPQAIALLRSLVAYLQYLAMSMNLNLHWPPWFLQAFRYVKAFINGIDLAAPECVNDKWSYSTYFMLLSSGAGALFLVQFLNHEFKRWLQRRIVIVEDADRDQPTCRGRRAALPCAPMMDWVDDNEHLMNDAYRLFLKCNRIKQSGCFLLSFIYTYLSSVLLQAWDCIPDAEGVLVLRSDPKTVCSSPAHQRFRKGAVAMLTVIGPFVPLLYARVVYKLHRKSHAVDGLEHIHRWSGLADSRTRCCWGALYEVRALAPGIVCYSLTRALTVCRPTNFCSTRSRLRQCPACRQLTLSRPPTGAPVCVAGAFASACGSARRATS